MTSIPRLARAAGNLLSHWIRLVLASIMLLRTVLTLGLLHTGQAAAQFAYANNQVTVDQDEDHVASNFPEVAGVELYSPSFVSPDTVPGGFTNGTSGPTDEATLGL